MLHGCLAEERHASFCKDLIKIFGEALSQERCMGAPFSQERVDFALPKKRVGTLAKEWISALLLLYVVVIVAELVDAAFGERLGLGGFCVEVISTAGIQFHITAAAVDVELRVAGCTAATCLAFRLHQTTWTSVGLNVVMRD